MPRHFGAAARSEWRRVVDYLDGLDALEAVDRSILERYCTAWADWVELTETLAKTGRVVQGSRGQLMRNPIWLLRREAEMTLAELARDLAVTPAARLRAKMAADGDALANLNGDGRFGSKLDELRRRREDRAAAQLAATATPDA